MRRIKVAITKVNQVRLFYLYFCLYCINHKKAPLGAFLSIVKNIFQG